MMKQLLALLFVCGVFSCTSPLDKNTDTAVKIFEAFNTHDWEKMASYYSDPALFMDPSYGKSFVSKSRKETVAKYRELQHMFPDVTDQVTGVYPSGDQVIVEFVSTGTNSEGASFTLPIICVLTFKDGLIIKDATYYDQENQ
jgi:ketosteroid isomerase-like protein